MRPVVVSAGAVVLLVVSGAAVVPASAQVPSSSSSGGGGAVAQAAPPRAAAGRKGLPVIGFGEYPVGTAVGGQYPGLRFASGGSLPRVVADGAQPTTPVLTGSAGFGSAVTVRFVTASGKPRPVSHFSLDIGYVNDPASTVVDTYDAAGHPLEVVPVDRVGVDRVTNTVTGVASFTVTTAAGHAADDFGWTIDNLAAPLLPRYVALGDSFSSGEGAKPFDRGTDDKLAGDTCHRSPQAWPRLLAGTKGVGLGGSVTLLACSGATTTALTHRFKTESAQLTHVQTLAQHPTVVTLTLGGNDVGFADILTRCYLGIGCRSRSERARTYVKNTLPGVLTAAFTRVRASTGPSTRVVVVGYPNLVNPRRADAVRHCPWLETTGNAGRLTALAGQLDAVARKSATSAGVEYVSALGVLKGHELCAAHSYVNRIGLTGGQLRGHPTLKGQQKYAAAVARYFRP